MRKSTILIADDHHLLAQGMVALLREAYEVLGTVANGRQLVRTAAAQRPDLILLDVSMPEMNGLEAATQLAATGCGARLIFVTQQVDPQYIRAAFRAGACGYVSKQSSTNELLTALRTVADGRLYLDRALHEKLGFVPLEQLRRAESAGGPLTQRQREVLQLLADGKTTREIAGALKISAKTVEFHKKALMDSTGLRSAAELTRYALSNGFIVP